MTFPYDIKILYENDLFLVVDKPPGLVVHGDGKTEALTLTDWLVDQYPHIKEVGEPWQNEKGEVIFRPGIVHRLDRETSGVLLIAKTDTAYAFFKKAFQERVVAKTYHAFVYGVLKERRGVIDLPIGRSSSDFRKRSAEHGARGTLRDAETLYEVLLERGEASFLKLMPKTGRTHQLRVHLKAVGHPIISDHLYAPKREALLGFSRLALHASTLSFKDPGGVSRTVEAPFPEDFVRAHHLLEAY